MLQTRLLMGLGILCLSVAAVQRGWADDDRSAALSTHQGRHLRLTTDLQSSDEIKTLVDSFDAAVAQWATFLQLPAGQLDSFQVDACVMQDKRRFELQQLIPPELPDFPFGYTRDRRVWVMRQPSEYYTRHLLLHEGVHALAYFAFQDTGPTWFQEGLAELLATHQGKGNEIQLPWVPADRRSVPYWGRFKRMQQSRDENTVPSLQRVLQFQPDLRGDVETYGWSWAAVMMFSQYPQYRPALLQAARDASLPPARFNQRLQQRLDTPWPIVAAQWRVMSHELDYGFDWSRHRVDLSADDPIWNGQPIRIKVKSDHAWQSIGVRIPAGADVRIDARGSVTLDQTSRPWTSHPDGITIQYHRGRPLGQLLACLLPNSDDPESETTQPLTVHSIGKQGSFQVSQYSWLLLMVNDVTGGRENNQGEYEVVIRPAGR